MVSLWLSHSSPAEIHHKLDRASPWKALDNGDPAGTEGDPGVARGKDEVNLEQNDEMMVMVMVNQQLMIVR